MDELALMNSIESLVDMLHDTPSVMDGLALIMMISLSLHSLHDTPPTMDGQALVIINDQIVSPLFLLPAMGD